MRVKQGIKIYKLRTEGAHVDRKNLKGDQTS